MSQENEMLKISTTEGYDIKVCGSFTHTDFKNNVFIETSCLKNVLTPEEAIMIAERLVSLAGIKMPYDLGLIPTLMHERESEIANLKTRLKHETDSCKRLSESLSKAKGELKRMEVYTEAAIIKIKQSLKEKDAMITALHDQISSKNSQIANLENLLNAHLKEALKNNKNDNDFKVLKVKKKKSKKVKQLKEEINNIKAAFEDYKQECSEAISYERKSKEDFKKIAKELQQIVDKHNNMIRSGSVFFKDGQKVNSPFLAMVGAERQKQFDKGRTIERDVLYNKKGELVDAALYCLDDEGYEYPKDWLENFKLSLQGKTPMERLACAAALLIAHGDMCTYVHEKNSKFEKGISN